MLMGKNIRFLCSLTLCLGLMTFAVRPLDAAETAAALGLSTFKDPAKRATYRPKKIPVYEIKEVPGSDGNAYRCKPIGTVPADSLVKTLPTAGVSGVYRKCQLVKLDFGEGNAFWIKFDWLNSEKETAWTAFMTRGSKDIFCFQNSTAHAAAAPGGRRAQSRYFC